MTNSYFPQLECDPIRKKTLAKQSEFSLIKGDKIVMLSFMVLGMDLVMTSDNVMMSANVVFDDFEHGSNNDV